MDVRTHYKWADRCARIAARKAHYGPIATQAHRNWQARVLARRYNASN